MTLIDTSAWIEALRSDGDPDVRRAVAHLLEAGTAALCDIVVLELWHGARGARERSKIERLVTTLDTVPTVPEVWETANTLAQRCRKTGVTVPATDLLVVAVARHHGLALLECDHHFAMVPA